MADVTKESNPKEAFGEQKMSVGLVPDTAIVEEELAFLEGALKYGQYNWRVAGVKASTYRRAIGRHLSKWWNGQDRDPATLVKELASLRACAGIMLDAIACGKFTDDRPPRADMEGVLAEASKVAAHLKQMFKDHNPPQYTEMEHGEAARERVSGMVETLRATGARGPFKLRVPEGVKVEYVSPRAEAWRAMANGGDAPSVPAGTETRPAFIGTGIRPGDDEPTPRGTRNRNPGNVRRRPPRAGDSKRNRKR